MHVWMDAPGAVLPLQRCKMSCIPTWAEAVLEQERRVESRCWGCNRGVPISLLTGRMLTLPGAEYMAGCWSTWL